MAKRDERLLTPAEFADAVGVELIVVQSRLNGSQSQYWRDLLCVTHSGARRGGRLLIPESRIPVWHDAVSQTQGTKPAMRRPGARAATGKPPVRAARPRVNEILMSLPRRAETVDPDVLRYTFVDVGYLSQLLSSPNHQVIFGRRGTGKTHALSMLASRLHEDDELAIGIDFRRVGSTGAYSSRSTPLEQRCTQLLVDVLAAIHDQLVDLTLATDRRTEQVLPLLDRVAEAISSVEVVGTVERTDSSQASTERTTSAGAKVALDPTPQMSLSLAKERSRSTVFERRIVESGTPQLDINFGSVTRLFEQVARCLGPHRIWILLDEWSSLPVELQPALADFLRRALLAVPGVIVKIAAIEDRSHFRIPIHTGDYMGLELGADVATDVNLDDFMVFDADSNTAVRFFSSLLHQHVAPYLDDGEPASPDAFVKAVFSNWTIFGELVRAAEGIPRDAINLAGLAAQRAGDHTIGLDEIKAAARDWYQRDKEGMLKQPEARKLLANIIDELVGRRKRRTFLLERGSAGSEDYAIRELYDARILHIRQRGVAAGHRPSVRYDAFVVDYGCYVDFSLPGYARTANLIKGGVPPDHMNQQMANNILDLRELRNRRT